MEEEQMAEKEGAREGTKEKAEKKEDEAARRKEEEKEKGGKEMDDKGEEEEEGEEKWDDHDLRHVDLHYRGHSYVREPGALRSL